MRPAALPLALACLVFTACGSEATESVSSTDASTGSTTPASGDVDEGGRRPVGLAMTVDVSSDGLTLFVGVNSCNGEPSATVSQGADAIRISVESYIPGGDDQDGCADEVIVSLDEPLGERVIVDEVAGTELRPLRVMPPALEALPREGTQDTFDAPDLTGLPIDEVLVWAEVSGLTKVDVFESVEEVAVKSEFDPHRLILVVEDGVVLEADFG